MRTIRTIGNGMRGARLLLWLALLPAAQRAQTDAVADETITVRGVSFVMKGVAGGTFTMGATAGQGSEADSDEYPVHEVTLSGFRLGQTEVTQRLWRAVMGTNPAHHRGADLPVEQVSWEDCQTFIKKLNALTGRRFRLPTEAEWEYAARGGRHGRDLAFSGADDADSVAWYGENAGGSTHAVATKQPNELGLYDMSGNVWEWCQDAYEGYHARPEADPLVAGDEDSPRVYRGGAWFSRAKFCRVACRSNYAPSLHSHSIGLRLAL